MNKPDKFLIYVRPWNEEQMVHLARCIWGAEAKLVLTSEHRGPDTSGLPAAFNAAYRRLLPDSAPQHLTEAEAADIVLRCRLLRSLAPRKARRLVMAMEHAISQVLTETRPSIVMSITIDSYVIDLLALLCAKRDIQFMGLVPSFINGHFRITARGEYVNSRLVSEAEVDSVLTDLVVTDYRPEFLVQTESELYRKMWRLWLRNLLKPLWFAMRRMTPGNANNYHFWSSQIIASQFWAFFPSKYHGISDKALEALAEENDLPLIYLPLQMSPEATIDYWSSDTRWIDYEGFIVELLRRYQKKWRFAVKEHPNLLGQRSRGFYNRLRAEPNCVMVSPSMHSNDVMSLCRGIVVCTGSAGFEGALRGMPILSDSSPYYAPNGKLLSISALDADLPKVKPDLEQRRALMAHILRGTLPGRFINDGTWSADNAEHLAHSKQMAASIRDYLQTQRHQ